MTDDASPSNQTILKLHILSQWANQRQERLLHPIERKGYEVETVHINDLTEHRSLHWKDNKPRSRSPLKLF